MNIDTDYPEAEADERRGVNRLLEDTTTNINFAIVRAKAFGRGYWFGYGSATVCALIWVVLDLWTTGRL
jgi:hypothetical protein